MAWCPYFRIFMAACALVVCPLVKADSNTLVITGSDTLAGLLTAWSVAFADKYPDAAVEIQAAGSAAAPIALAEGTASLGAMSRRMSTAELEKVVARQGYLPTPIAVARDALAIIVHPDNPLSAVKQRDLDGIYSATQLCGDVPLTRWSEVDSVWSASPPIEAYGRTSISGSYGFFKSEALCSGDYSPRVIELPGFAAIIDAVASTPSAIAYASLSYVNDRVKVLPLVLADGTEVAPWTEATRQASQQYPLARTLYLYLVVPDGAEPPETVCRFLEFINTSRAQTILRTEGFQVVDPLSGSGADRQGVSNVCH